MNDRKKIFAFVLVMACVFFCAMSWGENERKWRDYGDWTFAVNTLISNDVLPISGDSIPSIHTFDTNLQSTLEINFYPDGGCIIYIEIDPDTLNLNFPNVDSFIGKTVSGKISVGNENMHDVRFKYEKNDDYGLFIILSKEFYEPLLQKVYNIIPDGEIKIKAEGMPNIFEYSLFGFYEAMERCLALVKAQK